ncbi:hypothetical protein POSPLADRAFT_1046843 [Postia placenta MAD-698-R-SB12]|uniref:AMP-dependent synthetase/ligase domain-containing protein n=1 Tax=Postia placenta MAD-698-R-SB12 TaxID=670580 RepID=A0A1X6MYR8_9APHY|nr:hypothetical protein POSPLADRAFT_1046843 [Postia placenta MAD-698-R-SB12]OSX61497.1 hypothetical protein POSPLADRAFT_1046843 [Postia placenta MAD-698-R-SB12]
MSSTPEPWRDMSMFHSTAPPLIPPPDDVTVPQFLLDNNRRHPTRPDRPPEVPYLVDGETGREVHHDEIVTQTDHFARALRHVWGIGQNIFPGKGDVDYPIAVWAAHRLGAIIAMMSPTLTTPELVYQLQTARPSLLIAHAGNLANALDATSATGLAHTHVLVLDAHKLTEPFPLSYTSVDAAIGHGAACPHVPELQFASGEAKRTIAVLCFSSGTTGKPKAVAVSHYNVICNLVQIATSSGLADSRTPLLERRWRPGDRGLAGTNRGTSNNIGSRIYSAPLTAELTAQMLGILPDIHLGQAYGLTETCAGVTMQLPQFPIDKKVGTLGSAGRLLSGTTARVVKSDGRLAGVGEPGELWVKGEQVAMGYYRDERATRESFIDGYAVDSFLRITTSNRVALNHRWFRTGDEVVIHANGDIFITDRIKELIKVKGHQVAPAELEGHLLGHPHVADAGVVGLPDEFAGELPLAFVALQPDIAAAVRRDPSAAANIRTSIAQHVSEAKAPYKWLAGGIEFVEAIPKNASGKILRRVLRERARTLPRSLPARL